MENLLVNGELKNSMKTHYEEKKEKNIKKKEKNAMRKEII